MMDRDYDWSKFTRESLYGVPTPHDNSGSQVRSALHWMPQRLVTIATTQCDVGSNFQTS